MRKKYPSFCFVISFKARCVFLFCLSCFAFTSAIAQEDTTSWYGTHYYHQPVKKPTKYYPRTWAEDSLAGYSYGHPATSTGCNVLTGGLSTIFEDAGTEHFNTFGINGEFMHPINNMIGLTGDAGIYFGSNSGFSYNKIQVMVGASILPITPFDNKLIGVEPHLLAGFSRVGYNYKAFTYPGSTGSNTSFSMAAGTDIIYPIKGNTFYARIDYNPTFAKTATGNNIRVGVGIDIPIGTACTPGAVPPGVLGADTTRERVRCKASKNIKELKISLTVVEVIAKSIEEVANKIPRVEAKITLKPLIGVKQGEECCAEYGSPTSYTELKGSIEGAMEVNITLWGIPDLNYSVNLWPVLVVAEFKCKLFAGPTGKINLDGIGKFYGSLGNPDPTECKACLYLNIKGEANLRVGVKAGGSVKFFHWSPLSKGKAGYDVTGKADEEIEVSAEASASIGSSFNGTWAGIGDCKKPPPGVRGTLSIGKAKVNLKVTVKLGPLSFDPSYEIPLFDGWDVSL